jgi:transcriptional regulator with XRE-family HTH domain
MSRVATPKGTDTVGDRLRTLRLGRFLTQEQLAEMSGVGRATVARLESGAGQPHMRTISALAKALEVEPTALVPDPASVWSRRSR